MMRIEGQQARVATFLQCSDALLSDSGLPEALVTELEELKMIAKPWGQDVDPSKLIATVGAFRKNSQRLLHKSITVLSTAISMCDAALVVAQERKRHAIWRRELMQHDTPPPTGDPDLVWVKDAKLEVPSPKTWIKMAENYKLISKKASNNFKREYPEALSSIHDALAEMLGVVQRSLARAFADCTRDALDKLMERLEQQQDPSTHDAEAKKLVKDIGDHVQVYDDLPIISCCEVATAAAKPLQHLCDEQRAFAEALNRLVLQHGLVGSVIMDTIMRGLDTSFDEGLASSLKWRIWKHTRGAWVKRFKVTCSRAFLMQVSASQVVFEGMDSSDNDVILACAQSSEFLDMANAFLEIAASTDDDDDDVDDESEAGADKADRPTDGIRLGKTCIDTDLECNVSDLLAAPFGYKAAASAHDIEALDVGSGDALQNEHLTKMLAAVDDFKSYISCLRKLEGVQPPCSAFAAFAGTVEAKLAGATQRLIAAYADQRCEQIDRMASMIDKNKNIVDLGTELGYSEERVTFLFNTARSAEAKHLYGAWKEYDETYKPSAGKLWLEDFVEQIVVAGLPRHDSLKKAQLQIKLKEETDYARVKMAIGIMTAVQTLWKPLAGGASRKELCKTCRKQLSSLHLTIPPSLDLLLQKASDE